MTPFGKKTENCHLLEINYSKGVIYDRHSPFDFDQISRHNCLSFAALINFVFLFSLPTKVEFSMRLEFLFKSNPLVSYLAYKHLSAIHVAISVDSYTSSGLWLHIWSFTSFFFCLLLLEAYTSRI